MAYSNHEINALITVEPAKAKKIILAALKVAGMHKGRASKELSCAHSTLLRWIEKLSLDAEIAQMMEVAERRGWRHNGRTGRPKGSTVANGAAPRTSRGRRSRPTAG